MAAIMDDALAAPTEPTTAPPCTQCGGVGGHKMSCELARRGTEPTTAPLTAAEASAVFWRGYDERRLPDASDPRSCAGLLAVATEAAARARRATLAEIEAAAASTEAEPPEKYKGERWWEAVDAMQEMARKHGKGRIA